MKKLTGTALALGIALVTMLPGIAAAKLTANRNQSMLRFVAACGVIVVLMSALPGIAAAKLAANRNQTMLRT